MMTAPGKFVDSLHQCVARYHVEVVGWFIEQQDVWFGDRDLREY